MITENDSLRDSAVDPRALLKSIQKDLDSYNDAVSIPTLNLARTEKEVGVEIDRLAQIQRVSDNPLTRFSVWEECMFIAATPVLSFLAMAALVMAQAPVSLGIVVVIPTILAWVTVLAISAGVGRHPYPAFRNKVLLRKRYKREVRRILAENLSNADRYDRLRKKREKKLARAKKNLELLNPTYTEANPGQRLGIKESSGKLVISEADVPPAEGVDAIHRKMHLQIA